MYLRPEDYQKEERRVIKLFAKQNEKPSIYCTTTHNICETGLIYVVKLANGYTKIGCTKDEKTLTQRLNAIRKQYEQDCTLLFTLRSPCKLGLEKRIHENLKRFHINHYAGDELFNLTDELIESVRGIKFFRGKPVEVLH